LRELLPVLQLDREVTHRLAKRLRDVTRQLGPLRELDALTAVLEEMRGSGKYDPSAVSCVLDAVALDRGSRRRQASSKLLGTELHRLAAKLEKVATALKNEEPGRDADRDATAARGLKGAIDARIGHRAGKLKQAMAFAGNVYLADRVHGVRIALKKFRYAVELKHDAFPDPGDAKQLAVLKRRQDLLGRLHDRQVLMDRTRQAQASLERPDLTVWRTLDALLALLESECRRMHARYVRDSPGLMALCDQLAATGEQARPRRRAM
jgi:CHAD domain-containing protein